MPQERMSLHDQFVMELKLRRARRLAGLLGSQRITDKPRDR